MSEVEALLHEREHYVLFGRKDRVAQVDAELARLRVAVADDAPETAEESTPKEQATPPRPAKRPAKRAAKKAPAKKA